MSPQLICRRLLAISDTAFILANQEGKQGATITETIDLMQLGMCWNPEIKRNPAFQEMVAQLKFRM